jgi:alkanesulfonate monooxygenase SsuD/methylene tetrahydromethanopterin reductase-like flavin-dependent oxidoreductase (luciferase family)
MNIRDMVTIGKKAEEAGFDSLYVTEAWRSGFVPLTALALATQRVRLGPYVLNAYGRSPLLTGMGAIDLDELMVAVFEFTLCTCWASPKRTWPRR